MIDTIILWGGVAGAIIAIITLIGMVYHTVRKMSKEFVEMKEHNKENYLNNLRIF